MNVENRQMWCRGWLETEDGTREKEFLFGVPEIAREETGRQLRSGTVEIAVGEALKRNVLGSYAREWTDPDRMKDLGEELFLGSGHISHMVVGGVLHVTVGYD